MSTTITLISVEFIFVAIVCGLLLRYYRSSSVSWDVTLTVYLSWVMGFATVLLLPYDLTLALKDEARESTSLNITWSFVYWSTFILAWVIMPIQTEYHASGHFSFRDKLTDACRQLLLMGGIAATIGICYMIYLASTGRSLSDILALFKLLGNVYGVILLTILLGTGLIGLPRRLWQLSDQRNELRRLYLSAPQMEESYQDARVELQEVERAVDRARAILSSPDRFSPGPSPLPTTTVQQIAPYIEKIYEKMLAFQADHQPSVGSGNGPVSGPGQKRSGTRSTLTTSSTTNSSGDNSNLNNSVDYTKKEELVKLHGKLMHKQAYYHAAHQRWHLLSTRVYHLVQQQQVDGNTASLSIYPSVYQVISITCGCFSLVIFFSNFTPLFPMIVPSPMALLLNLYHPSGVSQGGNSAYLQVMSFALLTYLYLTITYPLFQYNLGIYRLYAPYLSFTPALLFNAEYVSRLQFGLGYNFLLSLHLPLQTMQQTAFIHVLGPGLVHDAETPPIVPYLVPFVLLFVCSLTYYHWGIKVIRYLGLEESGFFGLGLDETIYRNIVFEEKGSKGGSAGQGGAAKEKGYGQDSGGSGSNSSLYSVIRIVTSCLRVVSSSSSSSNSNNNNSSSHSQVSSSSSTHSTNSNSDLLGPQQASYRPPSVDEVGGHSHSQRSSSSLSRHNSNSHNNSNNNLVCNVEDELIDLDLIEKIRQGRTILQMEWRKKGLQLDGGGQQQAAVASSGSGGNGSSWMNRWFGNSYTAVPVATIVTSSSVAPSAASSTPVRQQQHRLAGDDDDLINIELGNKIIDHQRIDDDVDDNQEDHRQRGSHNSKGYSGGHTLDKFGGSLYDYSSSPSTVNNNNSNSHIRLRSNGGSNERLSSSNGHVAVMNPLVNLASSNGGGRISSPPIASNAVKKDFFGNDDDDNEDDNKNAKSPSIGSGYRGGGRYA